jgi:sugar phosphate isomerase/epimerase
MKLLLALLLLAGTTAAAGAADAIGLQMYSLRVKTLQQGWRAGLDQARALGFTEIEGSPPPQGVSPGQYLSEIAARGLHLASVGFSYESLAKDTAGCVAMARSLGVSYVMVAWIPHKDDTFTEEQAMQAARDFNAWGSAFRAAGITFTFHPHGYEFRPAAGGGTLFDEMARATNPADVFFEMDVFWVMHGGQDPLQLLRRYPGRWRLMHVKDIRQGAPTGIYTGHAPSGDDVAVGTGQVRWPSLIAQARADGMHLFIIEDESDTPLINIPRSVAYLHSLGL